MIQKADEHLSRLKETGNTPAKKYELFAKLREEEGMMNRESAYISHAISTGGFALTDLRKVKLFQEI